ncbi:MAG: hypothetical protein Q8O87_04105 [bacterium]|nr:hypothetical protein [bacterium]
MEATSNQRIIENLFLKKRLLEAGDPEHIKIRPVLLILGGGMRGVSGAGSAISISGLGLKDVFDVVVGVSAGAAIGAYFLSGLLPMINGATIYHVDLAPRIKLSRRPVIDVDFVEALLRHGRKRLNVGSVLSARSQFFVSATCLDDMKSVLVDAKEARPDMISAIKASMAIPGMYNKLVTVNDKLYIDGGTNPLPAKDVVDRFNPTDILIIANCTEEDWNNCKLTLVERLLNAYFLRDVAPDICEAWRLRYDRWHDGVNFLNALQGVNVGVLWTRDNIGLLTSNSERLKRSSDSAIRETLDFFDKAT